MAGPQKHLYLLDLSAPKFIEESIVLRDSDAIVRPVGPRDAEALAELMLEGYRGTIDYEGEEIEEAREAIAEFFAGTPLVGASMIASVDGTAASAVLVMSLDTGPFIAFVVSHPDYKRTGLARGVVIAACETLRDLGETDVRFAITSGNIASESLFGKLGAEQLP